MTRRKGKGKQQRFKKGRQRFGVLREDYPPKAMIAMRSIVAYLRACGIEPRKEVRDLTGLLELAEKYYGVKAPPEINIFDSLISVRRAIKSLGVPARSAMRRAHAAGIPSEEIHIEPTIAAPMSEKKLFYKTWEWKTLRMRALKQYGAICMCCGAQRGEKTVSGDPVRIDVDHIKSVSTNWDLRLDFDNLQVLCHDCNMGKGSWDNTDWRPSTE